MDLSLDPVKIVHYSFVSYDYFEHLYLSNINFYKEVRRIIQAAKQDYSLLMEKSIRYERIYKNEPLNKAKYGKIKSFGPVKFDYWDNYYSDEEKFGKLKSVTGNSDKIQVKFNHLLFYQKSNYQPY